MKTLEQHKDVTCFDGEDGYIAVEVTGREDGHLYTYSWTNGTVVYNTGYISSLGDDPAHAVSAGTWTVTVLSEDTHCSKTLDIVVNPKEEVVVKKLLKNHITTCSEGHFRCN